MSGAVKAVPGSKEDVFKNKDLGLVDKRRLMRFLMFAAGEFEERKDLDGQENKPFLEFLQSTFSLNEEISRVIAYSLAYCVSASDTTLPALIRIRNYLRSAGRYGTSSFLIGHYGGSGEIAQGFCRTAAVAGGIYILGRQITAITGPEVQPTSGSTASENSNGWSSKYSVELEDFPEKLTCRLIISSLDNVPPRLLPTAKHVPSSAPANGTQPYSSIARCIAIIDRPINFSPTASQPESSSPSENEVPEDQPALPDEAPARQNVDTAVLIFPPSSLSEGSTTTAVHVLITGEGCMATPSGKCRFYMLTCCGSLLICLM
jgi:RAB protein geranylgeranyltransferase component A